MIQKMYIPTHQPPKHTLTHTIIHIVTRDKCNSLHLLINMHVRIIKLCRVKDICFFLRNDD